MFLIQVFTDKNWISYQTDVNEQICFCILSKSSKKAGNKYSWKIMEILYITHIRSLLRNILYLQIATRFYEITTYLVSFRIPERDRSQLLHISPRRKHQRYRLHIEFHPPPKHQEDNKLMNLERGKRVCNDRNLELERKLYKSSEFWYWYNITKNIVFDWIWKYFHTWCVFWHPLNIGWNSTDLEIVTIEFLALLKTRVLRASRTFPRVAGFISHSASNTIQAATLRCWVGTVPFRATNSTTTAPWAFAPS